MGRGNIPARNTQKIHTMPAKRKSTTGAAPAVLAMSAITALSQKERISTFASRATVAQRAFIEMGKLMFAISSNLKKNETIYAVLRKGGVKDGTTSNASYASKVWELVRDGHLTETQYDTFTFQDVLAINRVLGSKSARRLSPEDVAIVIGSTDDFEPDLKSLYEHGLTVEEKVAKDKTEADLVAAATKAESDAPSNPAPATETPAPDAPASAPADAPQSAAAPEVPTIASMPAPKASADDAIRLLETVESMMAELPEDEQQRVARRVIEMAETINSFIDNSPVAKPRAGKKQLAAA